MDIKKTFCLLALAGVAVLPLGGSAAYDSSSSATGSVQVNVGTSGVGVGGSADADISTDTEADDTTDTTNTSATSSGGANLTGGLRTNALGIEVTSASQVASDADLEIFADNLMARDQSVANANSAAGSADVSYYHQGRLFGIFPVKVKARTWVTANEDGSVKVNTTMPWWSAFVAGTGKVRGEVDSELASSSSLAADVRVGADAASRARILETIASAHARLSTSLSATASTDTGSASVNADGTLEASGSN